MNKVAFITGASRGIGKATALAFARAGYDLIISARTLEDGERHSHGLRRADGSALPGSLASTAAEIRALGRRVYAAPGQATLHAKRLAAALPLAGVAIALCLFFF